MSTLVPFSPKRSRPPNRPVNFLLFTTLLLSTSSSAPDAAPAKKAPALAMLSMCEAVPRQRVEEALERRVWLGQWTVRTSPDRCEYEVDGGKVTIRTERTPSKLVPSREFDELRKAFPEARAQEFLLGNTPSMLLELPSAGAQVFAIPSSNQYVLVSILGFGDNEQVSTAARRIAQGALERLGL